MSNDLIEQLRTLLPNTTRGPWEIAVTLQHTEGSEFLGTVFPPCTIERYEIYTGWEHGQAKSKVAVVGRSTDERYLWLLKPDAELIALAPDLANMVIDLTERLEAAEIKMSKAVKAFTPLITMLDDLFDEEGRSIEYDEEDAFRMGEWFDENDLLAFDTARSVLNELDNTVLTNTVEQLKNNLSTAISALEQVKIDLLDEINEKSKNNV